jgi:hypothetical protein
MKVRLVKEAPAGRVAAPRAVATHSNLPTNSLRAASRPHPDHRQALGIRPSAPRWALPATVAPSRTAWRVFRPEPATAIRRCRDLAGGLNPQGSARLASALHPQHRLPLSPPRPCPGVCRRLARYQMPTGPSPESGHSGSSRRSVRDCVASPCHLAELAKLTRRASPSGEQAELSSPPNRRVLLCSQPDGSVRPAFVCRGSSPATGPETRFARDPRLSDR